MNEAMIIKLYDTYDTGARFFFAFPGDVFVGEALRFGRVSACEGEAGVALRFLLVFFLSLLAKSCVNSRLGKTVGSGLYSGCSKGKLAFSCTSGGRL